MSETYKIFIGWDDREQEAVNACTASILKNLDLYKKERHSTDPVFEVCNLKQQELVDNGIYNRPKHYPGEIASTQFAFTRFLVPYLMKYNGYAIFVDCDFIFTRDICDLFNECINDVSKAVWCVKHSYIPAQTVKMDGCKQTTFPRKNWSSLMVFNCSHECCKNLTTKVVNQQTPEYLHQMQWCNDESIGSLDRRWNWLVGEYDDQMVEGELPYAIHYTNGCPFMPGYENCAYASQYKKYADKI